MIKDSIYHAVLRTSALTLSLVLAFDSGLLNDKTTGVAIQTKDYLANAIGMYASVEPNELNTWTAALTQKELELNNRETALVERELNTNLNSAASSGTDRSTYLLILVLFILLVLITLNYYLDYRRYKNYSVTNYSS